MVIGTYDYDDDLIEETARSRKSCFRVYRLKRPTVVLGRGSSVDREVNVEACERDGIPVVQRRGGGCAVFIDGGNVIVSAVVPALDLRHTQSTTASLQGWLIGGLESAGIAGLSLAGISDLASGDRKVAGTCVFRTKDVFYYSACILVDADIDLIERYIRRPPREPTYRVGRSHADFLTTISRLGFETAAKVERVLSQHLSMPLLDLE